MTKKYIIKDLKDKRLRILFLLFLSFIFLSRLFGLFLLLGFLCSRSCFFSGSILRFYLLSLRLFFLFFFFCRGFFLGFLFTFGASNRPCPIGRRTERRGRRRPACETACRGRRGAAAVRPGRWPAPRRAGPSSCCSWPTWSSTPPLSCSLSSTRSTTA